MAVYRILRRKKADLENRCLLDEYKTCDHCGECKRCDLVYEKICDNCGKCLDEADYNGIIIDEIRWDEIK